jgi:hypothetical protein
MAWTATVEEMYAAVRAACDKIGDQPFYANRNERTWRDGSTGVAWIELGPHEDDCADSFAYSNNFDPGDGPPPGAEEKFEFMALASHVMRPMLDRCRSLEAAVRTLTEALHRSYDGHLNYEILKRDLSRCSGRDENAETWADHVRIGEAARLERDALREEVARLKARLGETP